MAVGAAGDATLSRGVRDCVHIHLHLLRGYILAEFSINQTDVSSMYRVVVRLPREKERERE